MGIHYIGEMDKGELNRTLLDQITDGQLEWTKLLNPYDITTIGSGETYREYPIYCDSARFASELKKRFPREEHGAIDQYVKLVEEHMKGYDDIVGALKLVPLALAQLLIKTGVVKFLNKHLTNQRTTADVIRSLTKDKDLQTIFSYCWGDYGSPPEESSFITQALLMQHFWKCGGKPWHNFSDLLQ